MSKKKLSHLDKQGRARMVDISAKAETVRTAKAAALVTMSSETRDLVAKGKLPKGDVFAAARLAGVIAAKRTPELIPLCHPLALSHVGVDFEITDEGIAITTEVRLTAKTGAEMEALTAAAVAALTIYDMVKGVEKGAAVTNLRLIEKTGGKSGTYRAK